MNDKNDENNDIGNNNESETEANFWNENRPEQNQRECFQNEDESISEKFTLFINEEGKSMHFILLLNDANNRKHFKELIEEHLGVASTDFQDFGDHSAALVDDENLKYESDCDAFKVSYIEDSIELGLVLDISKYLQRKSTLFTENFNYMKIIYFQTYTWENVPQKYKLKECKLLPDNNNSIKFSSDDSDCSEITEFSVISEKPTNSKKKTRLPYSKKEKETILHYILDNCEYDKVRGRKLWMDMEDANICPIRSWQSMKEHYLKFISKQLTSFSFITADEKKKLMKGLSKKNR